MGFLKILKKVKQKERELRILILGLDNAGYGFLCQIIDPHSAHLFDDYFSLKLKQNNHHEACHWRGP